MSCYLPAMKIIFLDIDGVLNSQDFFRRKHEETGLTQGGSRAESIDPDALRLLERIVEETDAKIVVSSCWRIGRTTEELRDLLKEADFKYYDRIIDRTKNDGSFTTKRGDEIEEWLSRNPVKNSADFIILDDDSDMGNLFGSLVQTLWCQGLTEHEVKIAIERLNHTNE